MHSSITNVRLAGLAVSTGSQTRDFMADGLALGHDRVMLERTAQTIGLRQRKVAAPGITALDLCEDAARRLLDAAGLDPSSIDAVIFVTQTPDHSQPNNASLLHGRLGLATGAAAFDLSLGCSGWVYGLQQAALLCAHGGAARVLLCAGDTLSRLTNPGDRSTDPLFGDAGSATLIEKTGRSTPLHFVLGADGSGAEAIRVKQGGARQPAGPLAERTDAEGNRTHDANLFSNEQPSSNAQGQGLCKIGPGQTRECDPRIGKCKNRQNHIGNPRMQRMLKMVEQGVIAILALHRNG